MATDLYTPATFCGILENAFYFEVLLSFLVAETDKNPLEEDTFNISVDCRQYWIRSNKNKFLLLNDDGKFTAQNLTTAQQSQSDGKFNIQIYNSCQLGETGRAVMLFVNKDGKKMVACCNKNGEIYPEAMDLPNQIEENAHKAVFYRMRLASTNKYTLESSLCPTKFLGFECDGENQTLNKLVLRHVGKDEVDESCEFMFCP
uniref:uncharacterized protein n=1 Tax=Semicossyphus pulcher TaxID=241346 RepID=UPI0037E878F8